MKYKWLIAFAAMVSSALAHAGAVNINAADAATLSQELKGIGPAKAAAIIEYRQKHGPFKSADELALVKGIGQKFIDKNRSDLRLSTVPVGKATASGAATPAQGRR
jgi:competence protein ComEA